MRKNTARHLLHALLDLLPVLTIPIFAIYITNHEPEPISITAETQEVVNFNQIQSVSTYEVDSSSTIYRGIGANNLGIKLNDIILVKYYQNFVLESNTRNTLGFIGTDSSYMWFNQSNNRNLNQGWYYERIQAIKDCKQLCYWLQSATPNIESTLDDIQVFNLTTMYGAGNEPSISDFQNDFPLAYYSYTQSELVVVNTTQVVYNDTDIGSQYIYQLYHVTDKYFNMGNVFNLGNVYEWFNVNIFYGQSPFVMSIVYNIIVYEFVMDLLFLLYGLFMWFIDMCKALIEKPINSIK